METPYYLYDMNLLENTLIQAQTAANLYNMKLMYAIKANTNKRVIAAIREQGFGIDAVTIGEIELAIECGFQPYQIVFAGSGKTRREIDKALALNIAVIHCESTEEWNYIAATYPIDCTTRTALRINPNVHVDTHVNIQTGGENHKFGLSMHEAQSLIDRLINENSSFLPCGFHFHVGSQITQMDFFEDMSRAVVRFFGTLPDEFKFDYLNLGGGLGINYEDPENDNMPNFVGWMRAIRPYFSTDRFPIIHLEPGRSLVGQSCKIIAEVQYIKERPGGTFAILDAGMNDLMRPALYQARHIITAITANNNDMKNYIVAGPSCESTDTFGDDFTLPILSAGDLVAIHSSGAYAESMRLNYNQRNSASCVYSSVNRQTTKTRVEDLINATI
jgi:diaminopimelate decarboxylase